MGWDGMFQQPHLGHFHIIHLILRIQGGGFYRPFPKCRPLRRPCHLGGLGLRGNYYAFTLAILFSLSLLTFTLLHFGSVIGKVEVPNSC